MTTRKINLSRLITSNLNPLPRAINWAHVFLLLSPAYSYTNAQPSTEPPAYQYVSDANINPSMAIIIVVLVCAFFTVGFVSIYIRQCLDSPDTAVPRRPATADSGSYHSGLDPAVIQTFPIFAYAEVKHLKIGKGALECAVCLSKFEDDETLRLLPHCDHVFHPDCIDLWLASHTTCPVCRSNLNLEINELAGDSPPTTESNDESSNEVSVVVNQNQSRDSQVFQVSNRTPRKEMTGKFPRSHSTGHSLFQPCENRERYTLKLPKEIRKKIMLTEKLKRTASFNAVLERGGSSRKGNRFGGYVDRVVGRSDRWVFSMTPPFVSWVDSVKSFKSCGDGTDGDGGNGKIGLTSVKMPLDCVSVKVVGGEESSARPPV